MKPVDTLSQQELQERFGWNHYLTRTICNGLEFVWFQGSKRYSINNIQQSISERLKKPKLKKKTCILLTNTSDLLAGKSNVIEVDFLKKLSFEEEMAFLMEQRQHIISRGDAALERAQARIGKLEQMGLV